VAGVSSVHFGGGNIFFEGRTKGKGTVGKVMGRILAGGILAKSGKTAHKDLAQRGFGSSF
jgi:hypothetical protein